MNSIVSRFKPPTDPRPGEGQYVFSRDLARAVRVALATSRPIVLRGWPGTGKSKAASAIARAIGLEHVFSEVVTSTTEARDLEWRFDAVGRLSDAQLGEVGLARVRKLENYVRPRALWCAFDPKSAREHDATAEVRENEDVAVVLIDEMDKAEPNVANDLLQPFDGQGFTVAETGLSVRLTRNVVLVVTTNEERDLPEAFLRRCVVHRLPLPDLEMLRAIGRSHFPEARADDATLARVASKTVELQEEAARQQLRPPAAAEYLDAVSACTDPALTMELRDDAEWDHVARLALWKHEAAPKR